jgi:hypothetical protein
MAVLRRVSWAEAIAKTGTFWLDPVARRMYTFNLEGMLHSYNDLPAVKPMDWNEGEWCKDGQRHRDGGLPAIVYGDWRDWWVDGKRHRDDGLPAVERTHVQEWWVDGQRHRDDGLPAVVSNKEQEWWVDGKLLHRVATAKVDIRAKLDHMGWSYS